jgi:hypothetical protein
MSRLKIAENFLLFAFRDWNFYKGLFLFHITSVLSPLSRNVIFFEARGYENKG